MKRAFSSSAKYYEALSNNQERLKREGPFLSELFKKAPGIKVVDISCGTGIHAEYFGLLGADVDAIDLSSEMIEHASKIHGHISVNYHTGDMRKLSGGPWDMAVCLGNSFSLLSAADDLSKTFNAVNSSLTKEGIFLVQILNYLSSDMNKPHHRIEHKNIDEYEITAVKNLIPHNGKTLLCLNFFSFRESHFESISETAVLTNWTLDDISPVAVEEGLTIENVYGGFDKSVFDLENSNDLICVFRKC